MPVTLLDGEAPDGHDRRILREIAERGRGRSRRFFDDLVQGDRIVDGRRPVRFRPESVAEQIEDDGFAE